METIAKFSTGALTSYPIMAYFYGNSVLNSMGQKWSLPLVMSVGGGLGYLLSDYTHDAFMNTLHVSQKFSTPASALLNIGADAAAVVATLGVLNPESINEIEKMKLLLASGGSAIASHYVYQNFVRPMYFSDSSYGY